MLYHLLVAVGGIFLLMTFWLCVQHWVREAAPDPQPNVDVLASRLGCGGCVGGKCSKAEKRN